VVREDLRDADETVASLRYRIRNSSQQEVIENVSSPTRSPRASPSTLPENCALDGARSAARWAGWRVATGSRWRSRRSCRAIPRRLETQIEDATPAMVTGDADNILTNLEFTWENFREVFDGASSGR
jgi:multiple sugar transport system permease protein